MKTPFSMHFANALREMTGQWNAFPNIMESMPRTTILGAYSDFTQTIHLPSIDERTWSLCKEETDYNAVSVVRPLVAHERCHFVDHIGTTWGQEDLVHIFNGFNVRSTGNLSEFSLITDAFRARRRSHLKHYYSEFFTHKTYRWNGNPWRGTVKVGFEIDKNGAAVKTRPLLLVHFSDSEGKPLCRMPLSLGSLLELRAMAAEMRARIETLELLQSEIADNEASFYMEYLRKFVYNLPLAKYSVAAHYMANRVPQTDVLKCYLWASVLARACLDMPSDFFARVRLPSTFVLLDEVNDYFLNLGDRAYLFAVLVEWGKECSGDTAVEWVNQILSRAGLPTLESLEEFILDSWIDIRSKSVNGPFCQRLKQLLDFGIKLRRATPAEIQNYEIIPVPALILKNSVIVLAERGLDGGSTIDEFLQLYSSLYGIYKQCVEFMCAWAF